MEILLPGLSCRLQVTNVPRNPLVSANGNADDMHSQLHHLRGTLVVIILTLGLWRWTMEMENGTEGLHPVPAAGSIMTGN